MTSTFFLSWHEFNNTENNRIKNRSLRVLISFVLVLCTDNIFDYSLCNGAFYYKGYQFAVIGNLSSFKKSDSKVQIVHINKEKLISMHLNSNENHICSWDFIKMNDKLICISYNYCGEYWFDEKYYQPEK